MMTLLPGGTAAVYDGLDRFGRVKDLLWRDYGASADAARIGHGYDYAGNRVWREDPLSKATGTPALYLDEHYAYDGLDQLTDRARGALNANKDGITGTPTKAENWSLDALGNWSGYQQQTNGSTTLNQSRSHNAANETTAASSWATPAYDAAGNMTTAPYPVALSDGLTLTYDAWNRLVETYAGTEESNYSCKYQFDGLNRSTVREVYIDGENLVDLRHFYYNEQWQLLEFHDGNAGQRKRQYVWGDRYVDDLILRDRDTNNDGTLEERLYAMQDPNWNVIAIAGTDGTVARRFSYAAYGKPEYRLANFTTISSNNAYYWDTFYTGRWYEEDYYVRLYHYRNRFYHAELGRFVNRDPIGYGGGFNLYEYVGDSPINKIDPSGLSSTPPKRPCECSGMNCKWSGHWRVHGILALFGGAWGSFTLSAEDDTACKYEVSGDGWSRGGVSMGSGIGWFKVEYQVNDVAANCEWPVNGNDRIAGGVVGVGGTIGIPLSISATPGNVGSIYSGMGWFSGPGGLNVFVGGVAIDVPISNINYDIWPTKVGN